MPELPEVETVARGLAKRVTGDTINSVWIGDKPEPLKSPASEIASTLEGSLISDVRRVGKHIVVDLQLPSKSRRTNSERGQWIIHLGMTGRVLVCEPTHEIEKHTHLVAQLASGKELRFVDPRRFGRLAVIQGQFAAPGSEPLDVSFDKFYELFHKRNTPIKSALLNQSLLSGVGNIYADEALARAGVRPRRRASNVTRLEYQKLFEALKKVLHAAIRAGGSSVSDYVNADGERGFFQIKHRVYGREGEPCRTCKTPIKRIVIAGRSSHFCPKCQH